MTNASHAPLHRALVWVTLGATFCLILLGGVVHSTGSSLACPDWPTCFGTFFPEMVGGVAIEHSHRVLATFVGVCTIGLAVLGVRSGDRRKAMLGLLALGLVVFQGVLGGVTVLLKLSAWVSSAHLATSMLFFSTLIALAVTFRRAVSRHAATPGARALPTLRIAIGAVYLQILLGALVRHLGAGIACGADVVRCNGSWLPSYGSGHLHMTHRFFALVVFAAVVAAGRSVIVAGRGESGPKGAQLVRRAWLLLGLVSLQILLGLLSVASLLAVEVVTVHLGVAALLLAALVYTERSLAAAVPNARAVAVREPRPSARFADFGASA